MSLPFPGVQTVGVPQRFSFTNVYARWAKRCTWLILLLIVSLYTSLHLTFWGPPWRPRPSLSFEKGSFREVVPAGERKLVVVLPTEGPSPNLCKVVASTIALGYSAPVIVNWKPENDLYKGSGPSHLSKITGVLDFLMWTTSDSAPQSSRFNDDDLVLMLDAHDVWLQLPPEVLLQRYFAANHRANELLARKHNYLPNTDKPWQSILASSQKRCYAPKNKLSDLHCRELPGSDLPDNIFGFFTDSKLFNHRYARPRYLNSGSFIGPVGDMRRYFRRVNDRMEHHLSQSPTADQFSGDQGVFAEVFGEQEKWRTSLAIGPSNLGFEAQTSMTEDLDYHVGLDYAQELFYPTCYSEQSGTFVRLQDTASVWRGSRLSGVSPPRVQNLPEDLSSIPGPLAALENSQVDRQTWDSIPLYVDYWTTSIPVAVHHNAWRDGLKSRQRTWWDKTWYFPYLRELLDLHMTKNETTPGAIAELKTSGANLSLTLWPYRPQQEPSAALLFSSDGIEPHRLEPASWDAVCQRADDVAWYDEVFRDGKGGL